MNKTNLILATGIALATMASCKSPQQVNVNSVGVVKTETPAQTEGAIQKVLYGPWTVMDVNGMKVSGNTDLPYVEFSEDASNPFLVKCYAYNGCNYLNGEYAVTPGGNMKPTSEFATTMRMCHDAPYEMGVNMALGMVDSYRIEKIGIDYILYLNNADGNTMLTLRKYDPTFINGTWMITSIEGSSVSEDDDIQLALNLKEKSVHGNSGCNMLNGSFVVDPNVQNSIQFVNLATTRMMCPNIQLEQKFLDALNRVRTIIPGTSANTASLRDEAGQVLITMQRIEVAQQVQ